MLGDLLDDMFEINSSAEEVFNLEETPMEPRSLVLNPGRDGPKNPLCPECEEQIVPLSNEYERQFSCGCDEIHRFEFGVDEAPVDAKITDGT
jgi:hypothetical protein